METPITDPTILRDNDRHRTIYIGGEVRKIGPGVCNEYHYIQGFQIPPEIGKIPDVQLIPAEGGELPYLQMPYYPGEVMTELHRMCESGDDIMPFLERIYRLVSALRSEYPDETKTLKKDTGLRYVKYGVNIVQDSIKTTVGFLMRGEIIGNFRSNFKALHVAFDLLRKFQHFHRGYRIHGCLHLEHIRIDNDGSLVPIDFEHGATYPRRLKYEDEAYIFQNILQYFPEEIAKKWLEIVLQGIDYEKNSEEKSHFDIALAQKMLGGMYEVISVNEESKMRLLDMQRHIIQLIKGNGLGKYTQGD